MSNFSDLIKGETPVLVDFYADWCQPCKVMAPILSNVADKMAGEVKVIKVDVDKNQKAAAKYKIRSIPTLILFQKGKIVWQKAGVVQEPQLLQMLKQAR